MDSLTAAENPAPPNQWRDRLRGGAFVMKRAARATWSLARRHPKEATVLLALAAILAGPFLLRPADATTPSRYDRRLVIITPHHEIIRREFGQGFARYWKEKTGETIFLDWRVPGGTSEIAMLLRSEFTSAFRHRWEKLVGRPWTPAVAKAFLDGKLGLPESRDAELTEAMAARREFLDSDTGIGVDLFFGGGPYDFQTQARDGVLVAADKNGAHGLPALRAAHPEWFSENGIPEKLSGEMFRDPQDRWAGTCLSSFGIVFNRDVLARLGIEKEPEGWEDLTDPRLIGQIALADPSKSGSVTKAFEMVIQQQMRAALRELEGEDDRWAAVKPQDREQEAVRRGWARGMRLIQRIAANARYFTDSSTKIPLEVLRGDAAAGMCIDYYGRSAEEQVRRADGSSRIGFVAPTGGTAISVDPIGMLRGAPDPELATAFMEFVLSDRGQKLWSFRPGQPGGPRTTALRRLPVRRASYREDWLPMMSDGHEAPYDKALAFQYESGWTGPVFNAIRFLIRVSCVDTHHELRAAWAELARTDFPPEAERAFGEMDMIHYGMAAGGISDVINGEDKAAEVRLARKLATSFRQQYQLTIKLARRAR
jgi:iron(III) transport system substrate-binding protein